jgi:hypothetical protein
MKSKRHAKLLAVVAGMLAILAMASPAAQAKKPNPGYTQFAGCPSPFTENAKIVTCLRTEITGGNFKMGNKNVPIEKTMTLTGGLENELKGFTFNSEGGLTKVRQKVPGGVIGLTGLTWLAEFLGTDALTLYAVTELAGTPTFTDLNHATLPIKVHLENSTGVLGSSCYVGSNSKPIVLNLTTGTTSPPLPNKPITGKPGTVSIDPVLEIFRAKEGIFVDNSFAAPGASGCVLTLFGFLPISLNGLVNVASGLPAAAGTNETKQNFNLELVNAEFPYE